MSLDLKCQICEAGCEVASESYSLAEIFRWWEEKGQHFSKDVLAQYRQGEETTLVTCSRCGFGIFQPTIVGTPEFYQELSQVTGGGYYSRETWEHRQALTDLQEFTKILEIGCGPGLFLEKLRAQEKEVQGIELNAAAVAYAQLHGLAVEQAELKVYAGEHREAFDAVCLFQVLEHVAAPLEFIGQALKCLRPGGLLIVTVPNMAGILGRMAPMVTNVPPHHVTRWTPEALIFLAGRCQLLVAAMKYEPADNFLNPYLQERLQARGVPHWVKASKIFRFFLPIAVNFLRIIKPGDLETLQGHTVYAAFRKV